MWGWLPGARRAFLSALPIVIGGAIVAGAVLAGGLALSERGPGAAAVGRRCHDAPITIAATAATDGVGGEARVCDNAGGVWLTLALRRLTPGVAYSAWVAFFDHPTACKTRPCSRNDATGRDPAGVIARMDGSVVGVDRIAEFVGDFRGLRLSPGAQVLLMVFDHGPAHDRNNHYRARQLLTRGLHSIAYPSAGPPGDWASGEVVAVAIFTDE